MTPRVEVCLSVSGSSAYRSKTLNDPQGVGHAIVTSYCAKLSDAGRDLRRSL